MDTESTTNKQTELAPPITQEELVARDYDGNQLASDDAVLRALNAMKFGRYETGETMTPRGRAEHDLGVTVARQVLEVHHYLPEDASGIVIQGRGIGAGTSDASYPWQETNQPPVDPREKGMDAAFASAIAAGLTDKEGSDIGIILPALPQHAADTYHHNNTAETNALTREQKRALLRGDSRPVADAQATAIWNVLEESGQTETPLHLIGASLSTAQMPEVAANLLKRGANVATLNLMEAVNIEKPKHLGINLLPSLIKAAMKYGIYLDANHRIYQEAKAKVGNGELGFADGMKKLFGVTALYGISLLGEGQAALRDKDTIERANANNTVINIAYGTESEFKTREQSERTAESLRALGYKNVITMPFEQGLHAITVSGSAFVNVIDESIQARKKAA